MYRVELETPAPHLKSDAGRLWRHRVAFAAKVALSFGLIWFAFRTVPIEGVIGRLGMADPLPLMMAVLSFAAIPALQGERWRIILVALGANVRRLPLQKLMWIGLFFNHILPSSIGGDALRLWYLRAERVPLLTAATSVIADRFLGIGVLFFIATAAIPWLFGIVEDAIARVAAACLFAGGFLIFVAVLWLGPRMHLPSMTLFTRILQDGAVALRHLLRQPGNGSALVLISLTCQILQALKILLIGSALGITLDWQVVMVLVPPLMLLLALPVSVGGWGVRENAVVAGLGWIGVAPVDALALSVLSGLVSTFVALPGAAIWLFKRAYRPTVQPSAAIPNDA